jgi:LPS sulfotransferase NodH
MTPRSGSTWLASLLNATGVLGRPQEFFNVEWPLRTSPYASYAEYLDLVKKVSATPNGIFGAKISFPDIAPFLAADLFADPRGLTRYVYLTREDLVLQGVSLYRADATGAWRAHQSAAKRPAFDREAIWRSVQRLIALMSAWETAFAAYRIRPLRISYEQLERGPGEIVMRIANLVGVTLDVNALSVDVALDRQRTEESEEWARLVIAGAALPGSVAPAFASEEAGFHEAAASAGPFPAEVLEAVPGSEKEMGPPGVQLRRLQAEKERLQRRTVRYQEELALARQELDRMRTSTSWRWTAPLRGIGRRVPASMRRSIRRLLGNRG